MVLSKTFLNEFIDIHRTEPYYKNPFRKIMSTDINWPVFLSPENKMNLYLSTFAFIGRSGCTIIMQNIYVSFIVIFRRKGNINSHKKAEKYHGIVM